MDDVFNVIDNFSDVSDLNNLVLDNRRKIQVAYVIFQESLAFIDSLKEWNSRATGTETYEQMKLFTREERITL